MSVSSLPEGDVGVGIRKKEGRNSRRFINGTTSRHKGAVNTRRRCHSAEDPDRPVDPTGSFIIYIRFKQSSWTSAICLIQSCLPFRIPGVFPSTPPLSILFCSSLTEMDVHGANSGRVPTENFLIPSVISHERAARPRFMAFLMYLGWQTRSWMRESSALWIEEN